MAAYDIDVQAERIFKNIRGIAAESLERGLDKAADRLVEGLRACSPVGKGKRGKRYRDCWSVKRRYRGVRYVGNTKTVPDKKGNKIPLSNILEYSEGKKARPHIRETFDRVEEELADIIKNEVEFE